MTQNQIIGSIVFVILIIAVGFLIFQSRTSDNADISITNFNECVDAGYPILESYPRQCNTPDGRNFVEEVKSPVTSKPTTGGGLLYWRL